jgi:hypothetical protein
VIVRYFPGRVVTIPVIDPPAWERSTATTLSLNLLVAGGQLAANVDGQPAEWIVSSERDRVPNHPYVYVVSFVLFHECGFAAPASRFMRGLCYHYGVELHLHAERDLAGSHVCRRLRRLPGDPGESGSLGPPLPRGIAYAVHDGAEDSPRGARRRLGARGAELAQGGIHPLHDDLQQHGLGAGMVLPPQRRPRPPPYTGKVLRDKATS